MNDDGCDRCAHVAIDGSWGPPTDLTHCHKCHRDWKMATRQAHCTLCCAHFSTPGAFDLHVTATGCRPPAEVLTKKSGEPKLVFAQDRFGPIWRQAGENPWARDTANVPGATSCNGLEASKAPKAVPVPQEAFA